MNNADTVFFLKEKRDILKTALLMKNVSLIDLPVVLDLKQVIDEALFYLLDEKTAAKHKKIILEKVYLLRNVSFFLEWRFCKNV